MNRYYIGETEHVGIRLGQHIRGLFKGSYTTRASDWLLILEISCGDRTKAREVEAFLKRMRNRAFLERFIADTGYRTSLLRDRFTL